MKILQLLKLDAKSKDEKAQGRKAKELAREQDILINELAAKVDANEVEREELESISTDVNAKEWVKKMQNLEVSSELDKKKLEIAERTKKIFFSNESVSEA